MRNDLNDKNQPGLFASRKIMQKFKIIVIICRSKFLKGIILETRCSLGLRALHTRAWNCFIAFVHNQCKYHIAVNTVAISLSYRSVPPHGKYLLATIGFIPLSCVL